MDQSILKFSLIGIIIILLITVIILALYNRHAIAKIKVNFNDNTVYQDKLENNSELVEKLNISIIDYINSLKIPDGKELNKFKNDTNSILSKLNVQMSKKNEEINSLKVKIESNDKVINLNNKKNIQLIDANKKTISSIRDDLLSLRQGNAFDMIKVSINILTEFDDKYYPIDKNMKSLLVKTNLLFITIPIGLSNDYNVKPVIGLMTYKPQLFTIIDLIIKHFDISLILDNCYYYFESNYGHPFAKGTMLSKQLDKLLNKDMRYSKSITTKHLNFIYNIYLPRLLNYIINNKKNIYNQIDEMMINYYYENKYGEYDHFNEFFTSIKLSDVLIDTSGKYKLIVNIMKAVHKEKYEEFSSKLFTDNNKNENENHFESQWNTLLYILLPEFLIMLNYNTDFKQHNPYLKFLNSKSFSNISDYYLSSGDQASKYIALLSMFSCEDSIVNAYNIERSPDRSPLDSKKYFSTIIQKYYQTNDTFKNNCDTQLVPYTNNAINRFLLHPDQIIHPSKMFCISNEEELLSFLNRLKGDTSDSFQNCDQLNVYLKMLKDMQFDTKDHGRISDLLNQVDPTIRGLQGLDVYINNKLRVITNRLSCVKKDANEQFSEYVSVKDLVDKVMVDIIPIMRNDFKSCQEFKSLTKYLNSFPIPKDIDVESIVNIHNIINERMVMESLEEEYVNPFVKGNNWIDYLQELFSNICTSNLDPNKV